MQNLESPSLVELSTHRPYLLELVFLRLRFLTKSLQSFILSQHRLLLLSLLPQEPQPLFFSDEHLLLLLNENLLLLCHVLTKDEEVL